MDQNVTLRAELSEIKGSLILMNQQLERAYRALDRLGQVLSSRGRDSYIRSDSPVTTVSNVSAMQRCESEALALQQQSQDEMIDNANRGIKRPFESREIPISVRSTTIVSPTGSLTPAPKEGTAKKKRISPPEYKQPKREDLIGTLAALSDEILAYIFNFLDLHSLCSLSLACASIRMIAESFPWRKVYLDRFGMLEMPPLVVNEPFFRWKLRVLEARKLLNRWGSAPREQIVLKGHNRPVSYLQFRGNKLLSCDDSVMRQWELSSGKPVVSFATDAKNKCYHFQFDDKILVVSNVDAIRVYDGESSEFLYLLEGVESYANRLKLTSEFIVGGMWDGYIRTWRITDKGRLTAKFFGHLLPVYCLDAVPEKIVSGSSDKWIKVYDAQLLTQLSTLKGHTMTVTALQLNEQMGCMYSGSRDKCIIRWDMRARNSPIHRWMGHEDMISALQFDGFKLVTGSMDSCVKVWDIRTTKTLYTIPGNEGGVRCLQFCGPDLVIGGSDGVVTIRRFVP